MASTAGDGNVARGKNARRNAQAAAQRVTIRDTGNQRGGRGAGYSIQSPGTDVTSKMRLPSQAVLAKNAGATAPAKARKAPAKAAPKLVKGPIERTKNPNVVQQRVSMAPSAVTRYSRAMQTKAPTPPPKRPVGPSPSKRRSE